MRLDVWVIQGQKSGVYFLQSWHSTHLYSELGGLGLSETLFVLLFKIAPLKCSPRQEGQLIPDYCNWAVKSGEPIYLDLTLCYSVGKCCSALCFFKFWRQKILMSGSCLPIIKWCCFYLHFHKCQLLSESNFLDSPVFAMAISSSGSMSGWEESVGAWNGWIGWEWGNAKGDEDVSSLQSSLVCACRNRLGYAHLWIGDTDLQLPEFICNKGTSDYFSVKEIKC